MPTQASPSLIDLLRVLNDATDKSRLNWNKTADENSFRAEFGLAMVRIWKSDDSSRYNLALIDRDGTTLDEFQPREESDLTEIDGLYRKARRQALDLDQKLKSVYDWLKRLADE
jgi:hypothetical protein